MRGGARRSQTAEADKCYVAACSPREGGVSPPGPPPGPFTAAAMCTLSPQPTSEKYLNEM